MRIIKRVSLVGVPLLSFILVSAFTNFTLSAQESPRPVSKEAASGPDEKDPVVLTVGARQIRASELEKRIDGLPPQMRSFYKGQGKRQFIDELVRMELLTGEAIRRKLDTTPEVKLQLEMARSSILANAGMQALEKEIPVSDPEAKAYFDGHTSEFEEIRVRHLLVRHSGSVPAPPAGSKSLSPEAARAKAQSLRQQILDGADFAQLTQKNSDDPGSATRGGDVGFLKRGTNVPPFEQAAFALNPGQISDVVETPYGFHIIKMESRRTFEEVKDQVVARVRQNKGKEKLAELTKQVSPVVNESYFQPAHAPHAGEPIPSYEMEARPKTKNSNKGAVPPNGVKP